MPIPEYRGYLKDVESAAFTAPLKISPVNQDFDGDELNLENFLGAAQAEAGSYMSMPKAETNMAIRSFGESEVRLSAQEYFNRKAQLSEMMDYTTETLESLPRFIIDDVTQFTLVDGQAVQSLRLPYERCVFVVSGLMIVVDQQTPDSIFARFIPSLEGQAMATIKVAATIDLKDTVARISWLLVTPDPVQQRAMLAIVDVVDGLACGMLQGQATQPPAGRTIPDARTGDVFRVLRLRIGTVRTREDWKGGTHASPREHTRRGHWRRTAKGPIWIKEQCINAGVTSKADKHYHVSRASTEQSAEVPHG